MFDYIEGSYNPTRRHSHLGLLSPLTFQQLLTGKLKRVDENGGDQTPTNPKGITMSLSEPLRKQISELVSQNRVVLFMKGTRSMPQCGFSAQVVKMLDALLPSYETVDALRSPEIRDGIKAFSEWPTIPQLYVDGQFIGGCDIVREMHASGELQKLIGVKVSDPG